MILLWENLISATLALPLRKGCLFDSLSFGVFSHKGTITLRSSFGVASEFLRKTFVIPSEWYRSGIGVVSGKTGRKEGGMRGKNR